MIPGTGPGRGVPWWRSGRVLLIRFDRGLSRYPLVPAFREGRLLARRSR